MSSNNVTVAEYAGVVIDNYCEIAATALIIYESMIITGQEARYFWSERLTGAAVLFYLNKYLTLFSFVYTMIGFVPEMSQQRCTAVVQSTYVIEILVYFPWAAFSGLRAFALSRIWALALFIFCISLVPIAVNWANFWYGVNGVNVPLLGCVSNVLTPTEITRKFTIASRVSLIVADCLLIFITWFSISSPQHFQMRKNTFATVLLRDGLIYFLSLLMLNSLHLILTMLSDSNIPSLQDASFVSLFAEPLTTILVSRFLLHLQSAKHKTVGSSTFTTTSSQGASIMFDRVIGSLDQSLSVDDFYGVDMDEDETAKDSSKDYKEAIRCEVIELPIRSPSTEGAVDCDIVEVC